MYELGYCPYGQSQPLRNNEIFVYIKKREQKIVTCNCSNRSGLCIFRSGQVERTIVSETITPELRNGKKRPLDCDEVPGTHSNGEICDATDKVPNHIDNIYNSGCSRIHSFSISDSSAHTSPRQS